jgi:midasin
MEKISKKKVSDDAREIRSSEDNEAKTTSRLYALRKQWETLEAKISSIEQQLVRAKKSFCFSFVEGLFISALRNGDWVLLDEINLAPSETLERIASILDSEESSVTLTERGDVENIPRHSNFRLFACMNPPTDVGKRDLPPILKARFSEIYVDELDSIDELSQLVSE